MNSFEGPVQSRLIRKSTLNGDVGKWQAGIRHKISGLIHSTFSQPLIRWSAKSFCERPGKMTD